MLGRKEICEISIVYLDFVGVFTLKNNSNRCGIFRIIEMKMVISVLVEIRDIVRLKRNLRNLNCILIFCRYAYFEE